MSIRKSRGTNVLIEVLTRRFKGIIVCDGWKPYARFTKKLQRCWAHLLRESKDLSEKFDEAVPLHGALKELYKSLTKSLECDPPARGENKYLVIGAGSATALDRQRVLGNEGPKIHRQNQQWI